MKHFCLWLGMALLLSRLAWAQAWPALVDAGPLTEPAREWTSAETRQAGQWLDQLNNDDESVRQQGYAGLMGLSHADLPALRQLLIDRKYLTPAQIGPVRAAVEHLYLQPLNSDPTAPAMLGLRWGDPADQDPEQPDGVVVEDRLPGFSAYALLRAGDALVDYHTKQSLIQAVGMLHPGQQMKLNVRRNSVVIEVRLTLNARPSALGGMMQPEQLKAWQRNRLDEAAQYWEAQIGPMLGDATEKPDAPAPTTSTN